MIGAADKGPVIIQKFIRFPVQWYAGMRAAVYIQENVASFFNRKKPPAGKFKAF